MCGKKCCWNWKNPNLHKRTGTAHEVHVTAPEKGRIKYFYFFFGCLQKAFRI